MALLHSLFLRVPYVGKPLWSLFCFCIVATVVVSVHEFGHLLAALVLDVPIKGFSIGFGPEVFGFDAGGIHWQLSSIPLGGYVSLDSVLLSAKPLGIRLVLLLCGSLANLVFLVGTLCVLKRRHAFDLYWGGILVWPFLVNAGQAGAKGWASLIWYSAVISLDLALINLLPLYPFDGGRMFVYVLQSFPNFDATLGAMSMLGMVISVLALHQLRRPSVRRFFARIYAWMGVTNFPTIK